MSEILFFALVAAALGFWAGWSFREYKAKQRVAEYNRLLQALSEQVKVYEIKIRVDRRDGELFVYNSDTQEFLAQGKTRKDVEAILRSRFPDMYFTADESNLKEVRYYDTV